jgi:hypothetical protein
MSDGGNSGKQDTIAESVPGYLSPSEQKTSKYSHVVEVTEQSAPTSVNEDTESNDGSWISIAESPENDQEGKAGNASHQSKPSGSDIDDDDVDINSPMSNDLSLSSRHGARGLSPVDVVCAQMPNRWNQEEDETPSCKQRGVSFQGKDDLVAALEEPDNDTPGNGIGEVVNDGSWSSTESSNVVLSAVIAEKKELEDQLEELPKIEAVEAERNKLRKDVKGLEAKLEKKSRELAEKEVEIKDATEYALEVQDDLHAANQKVGKLESGVSAVCSTMEKLTQRMSRVNENIDWSSLQDLTRNLADGMETKELREQFEKFIHGIHTRIQFQKNENEYLERKLNEQAHEFAILEKAKISEEDENLAMSPQSPGWANRNSFESLYNTEKAKRKVVEEKLKKVQEKVEKKCSEDIKGFQDKLTTMQEENATLSQKLENTSHLEEELKAANSRFQQREDAFEKKTQEQQDEINRYIEEYYGRTDDPMYSETTCLQKQLTAKQEELAATVKMFKEVDMENIRLRNKMSRLEDSNNLYEIQMRQLEQILPSQFYTMTHGYKPKRGTLSQPSFPSEFNGPRQANDDQSSSCQSTWEKRKAMLAERVEARRKAREDDATLDRMIKKLREQKMEEFYPPRKTGWRETRETSAWKRWGGDEWVKKQSVTNEEERVLRIRGLWHETN